METKKSERVDIERWKQIFFKFGIVVSLTLVLSAFEWNSPIGSPEIIDLNKGEIIDVDLVISTDIPKPLIDLEIPKAPLTSIINVIEDGPETNISLTSIEDATLSGILPVEAPEEIDVIEIVPLHISEFMPEFLGGQAEMFNYLQTNTNYPRESLSVGSQGTVYVAFIVERDGSLSNFKIMRPVDSYLDSEAIRVVKSMPRWKPGYQGGKAVRVHMVLPIKFELR